MQQARRPPLRSDIGAAPALTDVSGTAPIRTARRHSCGYVGPARRSSVFICFSRSCSPMADRTAAETAFGRIAERVLRGVFTLIGKQIRCDAAT